MTMDEKILKITDKIYQRYGSHYGVLFGIPANQRSSVEAIVKAAVDIVTEGGVDNAIDEDTVD